MLLITTNGLVYQVRGTEDNKSFVLVGNIKGPQGNQGPQGERGERGERGEQGPQGERGDVGGFINIWGIITIKEQLPTPSSINNLTVAYLVGSQAPYDLYVQVGETSATAIWINTGPFNAATAVSVGGVYQNIWDADTKLDKNSSTTGVDQVYVKYAAGTQGLFPATSAVLGSSVVMRNSSAEVLVPTAPTSQNAAVNKNYVTNNFMPKPDSESNCLIGWANASGIQIKYYTNHLPMPERFCTAISIDNATGDTAPTLGGTFLIPDPTKLYHAANKNYVDHNTTVSGYFTFQDGNVNFCRVYHTMPKVKSDMIEDESLAVYEYFMQNTMEDWKSGLLGFMDGKTYPGSVYYDANEDTFWYAISPSNATRVDYIDWTVIN